MKKLLTIGLSIILAASSLGMTQIYANEEDVVEQADENVQAEEVVEEAVYKNENEANDCANSFRYQNGQPIYSMERVAVHPNAWKKINGNIYNSDGNIISAAKGLGIDVSSWNGTIDWQQVKNDGIDFAIIRCGYGGDATKQDDSYFQYNVRECTRLGIPYGIYLYSYALDVNGAIDEYNHVHRLLQGINPSYPVYYDLEENDLINNVSSEVATRIADTFCSRIQSDGYRAGVYSNLTWFTTYLTSNTFNKYDKWLAQWNNVPTYGGTYSIWQCSSTGDVDGINGYVDMNIDYVYSDSNTDRGWQQIDGKWYYFIGDEMQTGWIQHKGKWYYCMPDTGEMATGWIYVNNKWYYMDPVNGDMKEGWILIDNYWYYLMPVDGYCVRDWQKINNVWYYFDSSYRMVTGNVIINGKRYLFEDSGAWINGNGWLETDKGWYYFYSDGSIAFDTFEKIKNVWYYFDKDGIMLTGFQTINGKLYYFTTSGALYYQEGWFKMGSGWYFGNSDGSLKTGWYSNSVYTYHFSETGKMDTGWVTIDKKYYYFDNDGHMKTGWVKTNNKWFYLGSDGVMMTGLQTINGKTYYLWYHMQTGWQKIDEKWYYFDTDGAMVKSRWVGKYYLGADGIMATGFCDVVGVGRCYFNSDGIMQTGWQKIDGIWYYFESNGKMATNKWVGDYYLSADGTMATSIWIGDYYVDRDGMKVTYCYVYNNKNGNYYWVNRSGLYEAKWTTQEKPSGYTIYDQWTGSVINN